MSQNEGSGGTTVFSFTVTRSGDTSGASTVEWAVAGTGANPADAADFVGGVLPGSTVSFAAGESTKTCRRGQRRRPVEPDEGFTVTLSNASNGTITTASANGMIVNDDVVSINQAPEGSNATLTLLEDGSHSFSAADFGFTDADGNTLAAVKITTLPGVGTLTLNGTAVSAGQAIAAAELGNLVYAPVGNANGVGYAEFTFQVIDDGGTANGGIDTDPTPNTLTFDVTPVNDAPTVANPLADQNATAFQAFSYTIPAAAFADVDVGDTLTYSATREDGSALPSWLSFNPNSRTFAGTPSNGDVGAVNVKVTASDGSGESASDVFALTTAVTALHAPTISQVTDDVAPVTGAVADGGIINDTTPTLRISLSGTGAVAGDSGQLFDGTTALGSAYP